MDLRQGYINQQASSVLSLPPPLLFKYSEYTVGAHEQNAEDTKSFSEKSLF